MDNTSLNLFDPIFDEDLTTSGNQDPLDDVHNICPDCGCINNKHKLDCEVYMNSLPILSEETE